MNRVPLLLSFPLLLLGCTSTAEVVPNQHTRPIVERDGRRLLWADEDEWFDVTGASIDPVRFQYGIGKDRIPSVESPQFVSATDPRLAAAGVGPDTPVLGVVVEGEARAYPVELMDLHEVVNDEFAGEPYAVLW